MAAFLGRSSATIARLPGGKRQDARSLWVLVGIEGLILAVQARESMSMKGLDDSSVLYGPWMVLLLILLMGSCGGSFRIPWSYLPLVLICVCISLFVLRGSAGQYLSQDRTTSATGKCLPGLDQGKSSQEGRNARIRNFGR